MHQQRQVYMAGDRQHSSRWLVCTFVWRCFSWLWIVYYLCKQHQAFEHLGEWQRHLTAYFAAHLCQRGSAMPVFFE